MSTSSKLQEVYQICGTTVHQAGGRWCGRMSRAACQQLQETRPARQGVAQRSGPNTRPLHLQVTQNMLRGESSQRIGWYSETKLRQLSPKFLHCQGHFLHFPCCWTILRQHQHNPFSISTPSCDHENSSRLSGLQRTSWL